MNKLEIQIEDLRSPSKSMNSLVKITLRGMAFSSDIVPMNEKEDLKDILMEKQLINNCSDYFCGNSTLGKSTKVLCPLVI